MVLAKKKYSNILKNGIFWCDVQDISSLIQNIYLYPILAQVEKSQN